jgi:molecular chaperone GrpE
MQNKGRDQDGNQQDQQRATQPQAEYPEQSTMPDQNQSDVAEGNQDQTGSMSQLQQKLQDEQSKAEEYLDLLRRTQADLINYRRRVTQEQDEARASAQINVLQQILPVIDDLDRALAAAPPDLANNPWVQGIVLASRRIDATLERLGVRKIGKPGEQFDPRRMEALASEPKPGVPEGTVLAVVRPGFALGDRIIRPAQVIVAGTPNAQAPTEAASTQFGNTNAG